MLHAQANDWGAMSRMYLCLMGVRSVTPVLETMAAHRANSLLAILPVALETGYSDVVPDLEPLKVQ